MKYLRLLYLVWLLPAYLLFLSGHQVITYYSINNTLQKGERIRAKVDEVKIKKIASQTNGWIILSFTDKEGNEIKNHKSSLPVNLISLLISKPKVDIAYKADNFQEMVIVSTAEVHKKIILINFAIMVSSALFSLWIARLTTKFVNKRLSMGGSAEIEFVRIDQKQQ